VPLGEGKVQILTSFIFYVQGELRQTTGGSMNKALAHYLDACIAVKLVTNEVGNDVIRDYMEQNSGYHFHITEFAFYETLSVLKRKWKKQETTEREYLKAVFVLEAYIQERGLQIDSDYRIGGSQIVAKLRELVMKYKWDFSDALQIHTVLNGKWRQRASEWKAVFVTSDNDLLLAAEKEGLRTWNFPDGTPPQ
jgi:predicted nucleic acid-binding protein